MSHTPTLALALSASCLPPLIARHTASTFSSSSSSSSSSTRMHHAHRTAANPRAHRSFVATSRQATPMYGYCPWVPPVGIVRVPVRVVCCGEPVMQRRKRMRWRKKQERQ